MTKILILSILFTIVYSWEEFKRAAHTALYAILRKKRPAKYFALHLDRYISTIVMIIAVPMGLLYLLAEPGDVYHKLKVLAIAFLLLAAGAGVVAFLVRYLRLRHAARMGDVFLPGILSAGSLLSPKVAAVSGVGALPRQTLFRVALFLSLPMLAGFILRKISGVAAPRAELLPNIDVLILTLVGALVLHITAELLKHYFRLYRLQRLFSYFRIVLGIVLVGLMLF